MTKKRSKLGQTIESVVEALHRPGVQEAIETVTETRDGMKALQLLAAPGSEKFVAWFDEAFVRKDRFVSETPLELVYQYWCREVNRTLPLGSFGVLMGAAFDVYEAFGWTIVKDGDKFKIIKGDNPEFPLSWYVSTYKVLRKRLKLRRLKAFFETLFAPGED